MTDEKRTLPAMVLVAIMLFSSTVAAANVSTFTNGQTSADVEIRDSTTYTNSVDGSIDLPAGETVTSATMKVSTAMATHSYQARVDSNTQWIWDPSYNNQQTNYSQLSHFTYNEQTVKLVANGFTTDFERTKAGFYPDFILPEGAWDHGVLNDGSIIATDCGSGLECWGTNMYDDNYTDDRMSNQFDYSMASPGMEVKTSGYIARFSSYHSLYTEETVVGAVTETRYYDCAYVQVANSSNGQNWGLWETVGFDTVNSTGIGFSNGLAARGSGNGKIQNCDGISIGDYALAGSSIDPVLNPTGWGTLAVNVQQHIGRYVKFRFVMERNAHSASDPVNDSMPGWFVDDFRLGDPLPASGWMEVKNFAPRIQPNPGFPDGYGVLMLETETTPTNSLSVDVVHSATGDVVNDTDGNPLVGLSGPLIQLWNINSSQYPLINFRFNFDSGTNRLSTPILHGFSVGTRIGSGFNDSTTVIASGGIEDGVWDTPGMGMPLLYNPIIMDDTYIPASIISRMDYPIIRMKPIVTDDCAESPSITISLPDGGGDVNLTNEVWFDLNTPVFSFSTMLSYQGACQVDGLWFDLEFGFNPKQVQVDIAGDGDVDWGFDEPAFGHFGRQTEFWANKVDGINYGSATGVVGIGSSGTGQGATFMMPTNSDVVAANFAIDSNSIYSNNDPTEGFELTLVSSGQEVGLGTFGNFSVWLPGSSAVVIDFAGAIQSLLDNPMVPVSHTDEYGNDWVSIHFKASSPNASTGASMRVLDLNILYDWEQTLGASHGMVRELSQGVALGTPSGGFVTVPIDVRSGSGGAIHLSDLSVVTSAGYTSSLSITGNPVGLYPDGSIIEVISLHDVDGSTGTTLQDCRLILESETGSAELSYSDFGGFAEVSDVNDIISLQPSSASDVAEGKQVSWRFTVNTNWDDATDVRVFAALTAANGVEGLPAAIHLAPPGANAVENDAGVTEVEVMNSAREAQDLDDGRSNQIINLVGSVRLENLDVAPDPTSYFLSVQVEEVNNTDPQNITYEWLEIANLSGPIGGDFDWQVDLGIQAAGEAKYRLAMVGYDKGTLICPSSQYRPDADCAVQFNLTIDTFSPNLVSIEVFQNQINWRELIDDTWISPDVNQQFRVSANDIPTPPDELTLNYWVEYDHDVNGDSLPDGNEYQQITLTSDGAVPTANYTGSINDIANEGKDPSGKVSIYVSGNDLAGNPIDGGEPGFDYDLITYVGMNSEYTSLSNFLIYDNDWVRFTDQQRTMYAGNTYHLVVEGSDPNGWRDLSYINIDLNPGVADDMVLRYYPRNDTIISNSEWLTVIPASESNNGTELTKLNGDRLINPFEPDFKLVMPIQVKWNVATASGVMTPQIRVKDLDQNNPETVLTESGGRIKQRWIYGDGILLDFPTSLSLDDQVEPYTDSVYDFQLSSTGGFVFSGDEVSFTGQYAFIDGWPDLIVNPETALTLELTREEASADSNKGYEQQDGEVTWHTFTGGVFNISITLPSKTNEYTYTFRLCPYTTFDVDDEPEEDDACESDSSVPVLPDGALDSTQPEQQTFIIKVDSTAPTVNLNSWSLEDAGKSTLELGILPSSTIHCVYPQVVITEPEQLDSGSVHVNWNYFQAGNIWPYYVAEFGMDNMSADLELTSSGDLFIANVGDDCIDLWPDADLPGRTQLNGVSIQFWVSGRDSAGYGISQGGDFGQAIISTTTAGTSSYSVVYEQAEFTIGANDVRMYPSAPEVGQDIELDITLRNTGNIEGNISLDIFSNTGGVVQLETTINSSIIGIGEAGTEKVTIEAFDKATTGVSFEIRDNETGEVLWNGLNAGKTFSVKVAAEETEGGMVMIILAGLGGLILILLVVVAVLVVRSREDDEGTELYDDYLDDEEAKAFPEMPTSPPVDMAGVSPEMQQALQEFPQWDQEQIQSYLDQGWTVETLRDWVNSN